jgi:hypothetical protein
VATEWIALQLGCAKLGALQRRLDEATFLAVGAAEVRAVEVSCIDVDGAVF